MSGYTMTSSKPWHKCSKAQLLEALEAVIEQRDKQIARTERAEADVKRLRDGIEAGAGSLWRETPCGCGHRADLHQLDEGVCIGGLTLCKCRWSFSSIVSTRLRALLAESRGGESDD